MPTLLETLKESARRFIQRLLPSLLRGPGGEHAPIEARSRSGAGGDQSSRNARSRSRPISDPGSDFRLILSHNGSPLITPVPDRPRKNIEHHHGSYRVRITANGRRYTFGPYKSMLTAVRVRNKILRAYGLEVPEE